MRRKETYLEKLERCGREQLYEMSLRGEEFVKAKLYWEDWRELLPRLESFAKQEIRRRRWRGKRSGVLPEGYDANSIASEVIDRALRGKARLVRGWTLERLEKELQRLVSNEVRRLHKRMETRVMRSEWEVLSPNERNEPRSVFDQMKATGSSGWECKVADRKARERQGAEQRIAAELGENDRLAGKLFDCLCAGVMKRRKIAVKLGISVEEVTNCRKRLNRKLEELTKTDAAVPRWVVEMIR